MQRQRAAGCVIQTDLSSNPREDLDKYITKLKRECDDLSREEKNLFITNGHSSLLPVKVKRTIRKPF